MEGFREKQETVYEFYDRGLGVVYPKVKYGEL